MDSEHADALLEPVEVRLLGCLLEKERTTPADYPLTANALMRAANQSTSRSPVVAYDVRTVEEGCASLKEKGLVRFVHVASGRATTKYRQVVEDSWTLDAAEAAVLALLMLRGPQTVGELKTRSERLANLADLTAVAETLDRLAARTPALVRGLGRAAGQKESRWAHLLCGEPDVGEHTAGADASSSRHHRGAVGDRLDQLERELGELRSWVIEIRAALGLDVSTAD